MELRTVDEQELVEVLLCRHRTVGYLYLEVAKSKISSKISFVFLLKNRWKKNSTWIFLLFILTMFLSVWR